MITKIAFLSILDYLSNLRLIKIFLVMRWIINSNFFNQCLKHLKSFFKVLESFEMFDISFYGSSSFSVTFDYFLKESC